MKGFFLVALAFLGGTLAHATTLQELDQAYNEHLIRLGKRIESQQRFGVSVTPTTRDELLLLPELFEKASVDHEVPRDAAWLIRASQINSRAFELITTLAVNDDLVIERSVKLLERAFALTRELEKVSQGDAVTAALLRAKLMERIAATYPPSNPFSAFGFLKAGVAQLPESINEIDALDGKLASTHAYRQLLSYATSMRLQNSVYQSSFASALHGSLSETLTVSPFFKLLRSIQDTRFGHGSQMEETVFPKEELSAAIQLVARLPFPRKLTNDLLRQALTSPFDDIRVVAAAGLIENGIVDESTILTFLDGMKDPQLFAKFSPATQAFLRESVYWAPRSVRARFPVKVQAQVLTSRCKRVLTSWAESIFR